MLYNLEVFLYLAAYHVISKAHQKAHHIVNGALSCLAPNKSIDMFKDFLHVWCSFWNFNQKTLFHFQVPSSYERSFIHPATNECTTSFCKGVESPTATLSPRKRKQDNVEVNTGSQLELCVKNLQVNLRSLMIDIRIFF